MRLLALALLLATPAALPAQPAPAEAATPAPPIDAANRQRVIEAAIKALTERYVFPEKAPVIGRALRKALASGRYDALSDPRAFADAVNKDIAAVANDRHMRLFYSAEDVPGDPGKPDPAERARLDTMFQRANFGMRKVELLPGNIGYFKINGFLPTEAAGPTMAAAMAFLKYSDAMIIDLRDNGGGEPLTVAMLVSYFVPPETLINSFHMRGKAIDDQSWTFPFVPGGRWSLDKPVYVLTSARTASGGEEFAYDIQQLKRGTIVGAVTWGGANPGEPVALDPHFALFVPFGAAVNPISKINWEGVGIKPDVAVDPAEALEKARVMALTKLLEGATGPRKADLQRALAAPPPGAPPPVPH